MNNRLVLKNTSANFLGKFINRGVRILLVPLQIKMLGEEAFGLLGMYALVTSLLIILDLGLSFTGKREIARLAANEEQTKQEIRDLIRTFEIPYWILGILAGGAILLSAGWFTDNWITAPTLPRETVLFSVSIMGLLFVARWPVSLYKGFLFGLQRQVEANALVISVEVLNAVGSIIVLLAYPKVEAFFLWQLLVGIVEILGYTWLCWRSVRQSGAPRPKFRAAIIHRVWRYALGINIMAVIGALSSRSDSLILSKVLPINYLGYYSIAQRVPGLAGLVSGSILPATTPLVVAYHEKQDTSQLRRIYHRQTKWLSFLGVGIAFPLAAFSYQILQLWTQSEKIANATTLSFTIISVFSALEVISNSVNQLSLSCGNTQTPIIVRIVQGAAILVGTLVLVPSFGITGAAIAWGLSRLLRFFMYPILIHRHILKGELKTWFLFDTLPFLVIGVGCFGASHLLAKMFSAGYVWISIAFFSVAFYFITVVFIFRLVDWHSFSPIKNWILKKFSI